MKIHYFPVLVLLPLQLAGASTDEAILSELAALGETVRKIEQRISAIEKQLDQESNLDRVSITSGNQPGQEGLVSRLAEAVQFRTAVNQFPWMERNLWTRISKGMDKDSVISILGEPTLEDPSLHKRVDYVLTYRGRSPANGQLLTGKIKFYRETVTDVEAPEFD